METAHAADPVSTASQLMQPVLEQSVNLARINTLGIYLAVVITISFIALICYVMWTTNKRELRLAGIIDGSVKEMHTMLLKHDTYAQQAVQIINASSAQHHEEHKEIINALRSLPARA